MASRNQDYREIAPGLTTSGGSPPVVPGEGEGKSGVGDSPEVQTDSKGRPSPGEGYLLIGAFGKTFWRRKWGTARGTWDQEGVRKGRKESGAKTLGKAWAKEPETISEAREATGGDIPSGEEYRWCTLVAQGDDIVEAVRKAMPHVKREIRSLTAVRLKRKWSNYVTMLKDASWDDPEVFLAWQEQWLRGLLLDKRTKPNERLSILREMARLREKRMSGGEEAIKARIARYEVQEQELLAMLEAEKTRGREAVPVAAVPAEA